jgi:hypothetical protein
MHPNSFIPVGIALVLVAVLLGGCVTTRDDGKAIIRAMGKGAVCAALVGPIKYNTENKASKRYAAELLALDLATRNKIGESLNCPKYR